ncbi:PREDICTED: ELMO domain-containing protein 3 [Chaetura pelagica]|uniref:ELMO domain-containing protein 3 n=1 Tax=Chaetura pelagica TaxID=8897 RepID=UPI000523DD24|nr:PREDICTED: ELMO domain-containing protein 3 [Chaetura pelagica]
MATAPSARAILGQPRRERAAPGELSKDLQEARQDGRLWRRSSWGKAQGGGHGLLSLLSCLCSPPGLRPPLWAERELVLAMATCPLDDSQQVHLRILQTIFQQLTHSQLGCPRYGPHWEELGFQGADPSTDLRGTGMLGLMQLLFLLTHPQLLPLAQEIFRLSHHETQSFPFCIMSVNITHMVLQALKEEHLSRVCNRRQEVIPVLNHLHAATFLQLFQLWRGQHRTIADASFVLKELEFSTKKKPKQLLKSLDIYMSRSLQQRSGSGDQEMVFTGVCDLQGELEGEAQLV